MYFIFLSWLALISSFSGKPVPANMVVFGEIGLSGEIRACPQPELRLKEAEKLGFEKALFPPYSGKSKTQMKCISAGHLKTLVDLFIAQKE